MTIEIIAALKPFKSLEKALRFLQTQDFALNRMDVIAQDEFNHDVIVPFASEPKYLVLGVT